MKTRIVREPEKSDGAHLAWLLGLILAAALIVAPLVWLFTPTPANAVVTSGYYILSTLTRNYDTWRVDSAYLYALGGWDSSNPDSTQRFTLVMVDGPGAAPVDSLARFSIITPANLDQDYNPVVYALWWVSGRTEPIRDDKPIVHMISYVDYLRTAVDAVAVVDYNEMDSVLSAAHGPGLWGSSGGTGVNVVRLYVRDTLADKKVTNVPLVVYNAADATTIEGWGITGMSGYYDFSLNDGTYLGRVSTPPGYLQQTPRDTIVVSGATQDTVEVYSFSPTLPGSADSTTLVFYLPSDQYRVKVTPLLQKEGQKDSSNNVVLPIPQYGVTAGSNIWQVKVLRSTACTPKLPYSILIFDKDDLTPLVSLREYWTPDSASSVVDW